MVAELVDRNRNFRFAPVIGDLAPFDHLRELVRGSKASSANPHLEFEVDREFFLALEAQAKDEAEAGKTENVLIEMQDGRNLPSFLDIPILVQGGHAPELSPAEFKAGPVDPRLGEE